MDSAGHAGYLYASRQWIGHRPHQEDCADFYKSPDGGLLALLADGMGGHLAGEIAAQEVTASFARSFLGQSGEDIPARFRKALDDANRHLRSIQGGDQIGNTGTTLIAVFLKEDLFWRLSVGDSMLLLWKDRRNLLRLNEDHSMRPIAEAQWARGEISLGYALRQRSILRSAIMGDYIALVDIPEEPSPLGTNDFLILASDGLDEWVEGIRQIDLEHMREAAERSPEDLLSIIAAQVDALDISYADNGTVSVIGTRR